MDDPDNYRFIIDCMLNVPLLYWASSVTGKEIYRDIAAAHTATCLANSFRPDGSTYHTFYMNPDGTPKGGRTCQGYRDDSFWARGQAWGVYGSAIGYTYTHDATFLDVFRKALDFYLSRLPEDLVPCWDMIFAPESGEPRDSSSAAIVACGLLEAAKYGSPKNRSSGGPWPGRCWRPWRTTTPSGPAPWARASCCTAPTARRAPTTPAPPKGWTSAPAGAITSTWRPSPA